MTSFEIVAKDSMMNCRIAVIIIEFLNDFTFLILELVVAKFVMYNRPWITGIACSLVQFSV
jgi:hypothetical protein